MRVAVVFGCVLWMVAIDLGATQTTQATLSSSLSWFVKPYQAKMKKGELDATSSKGKKTALTADKANVAVNANVEGRGDFSAKRAGNPQEIQLKSAGGATADADQSQKASGVRTADFNGKKGKYHGEMKQVKSGNNQVGNLTLNTGQKFNFDMIGNKTAANAGGSRGNRYNLKPQKQTKTDGSGTISMNSNTYNYQESKTANGDSSAQLSNIGSGPSKQTWTCQGQKQGISNCVNKDGLPVGQVISQPGGTVIVQKAVAKGVYIPFAQAKPTKTADGKNGVTVNDGLFQAQSGNYKERDCMADYGKKAGSSIQIQKPFTFGYNSQTGPDGKKTFTFPDCINFGGKIVLPPGVDANRLAVQFDASILPAGKLKCVDPGSCNKDCYYCNFCNNSRKVDMLANSASPNLCNAKGGNSYDVRVTACPPPSSFNTAYCSGFTKSDPTYFKKKGDVQARLLFWLRPANEATVKTEFHAKLKADTTGFVRKGWVLSYAVDNKNLVNANNPTDFDLQEWYIHKYGGSDTLVGCIEGTSNYTVSGQKVKTDFLLEAGTLAAAPKSLFDTKTCPQVDKINQAQAQADAAEAAKSFTTKKPSVWSSFLGGKGGTGK